MNDLGLGTWIQITLNDKFTVKEITYIVIEQKKGICPHTYQSHWWEHQVGRLQQAGKFFLELSDVLIAFLALELVEARSLLSLVIHSKKFK
jgi:hypothetical protein